MSEPEAMLRALGEPFPRHAIKQRQGGGNQMFDYVETETVIRRLNATVKVWDFRITEIKVIDQLLVVWGEMTIPGLGTRAGTGVQRIQGGEDMWKGAASDCLKKCATLFNVAIDLYGPDLEGGEMPETPNLPPRDRTTSQNTVPEADPNAITSKQIGMIRKVAEEKGIPPEDVRAMHGKPSAKELTKQEASKLIERLMAMDSRRVDYDPRIEQDVLSMGDIAATANRFLS